MAFPEMPGCRRKSPLRGWFVDMIGTSGLRKAFGFFSQLLILQSWTKRSYNEFRGQLSKFTLPAICYRRQSRIRIRFHNDLTQSLLSRLVHPFNRPLERCLDEVFKLDIFEIWV